MLSIRDYLSDAGIDKWVQELGCANAPVPRGNIRKALSFFATQMPALALADAVGFLAAMDLSKDVAEVTLPPGHRLMGFRSGNESPFKLFFAPIGSSPEVLGITSAGRKSVYYTVRSPVRALQSFTAGVKVTWGTSAPGRVGFAPRANKWFGEDFAFGVLASGGGRQLIVPESSSHLLVERDTRGS